MQLYNHWMVHGEHEATAAGNTKPPGMGGTTSTCGITTALDGSEDHLIHCLKDGNGMPNVCYKLAQEREEAEAANLAELMAGFELDLDEDDVGNVSDAEIVDEPREEGNNNAESDCSDDREF
ncbi:pogo transposable element with KRAB domain-like protein [Aphelenchoides avenae]|nr:pogo transposable element with KRAB domain-like protein [Aphelenchus avenae]